MLVRLRDLAEEGLCGAASTKLSVRNGGTFSLLESPSRMGKDVRARLVFGVISGVSRGCELAETSEVDAACASAWCARLPRTVFCDERVCILVTSEAEEGVPNVMRVFGLCQRDQRCCNVGNVVK